jgi:hypothetical protein
VAQYSLTRVKTVINKPLAAIHEFEKLLKEKASLGLKDVQKYKPLLLASKSLFSLVQHVMEVECSTSLPSKVGCRHIFDFHPLSLRWARPVAAIGKRKAILDK